MLYFILIISETQPFMLGQKVKLAKFN